MNDSRNGVEFSVFLCVAYAVNVKNLIKPVQEVLFINICHKCCGS